MYITDQICINMKVLNFRKKSQSLKFVFGMKDNIVRSVLFKKMLYLLKK